MFVYMVQDDDTKLVKIGYSASPDRRIKDLNSLFSQPLRRLRILEGTRETERWLHERFAAQKSHHEWFLFCEEMLTVIPPDPDSLRSDQEKDEAEYVAVQLEMRDCIQCASADMPTDTTVKKRLHEVSRRFGISYQRVRSLWHMDARHVTAWEADRIRKITHALQIEQAEKYEAMAAQIKAKIASRNLKRSQPRDQLTMELIRDGE